MTWAALAFVSVGLVTANLYWVHPNEICGWPLVCHLGLNGGRWQPTPCAFNQFVALALLGFTAVVVEWYARTPDRPRQFTVLPIFGVTVLGAILFTLIRSRVLEARDAIMLVPIGFGLACMLLSPWIWPVAQRTFLNLHIPTWTVLFALAALTYCANAFARHGAFEDGRRHRIAVESSGWPAVYSQRVGYWSHEVWRYRPSMLALNIAVAISTLLCSAFAAEIWLRRKVILPHSTGLALFAVLWIVMLLGLLDWISFVGTAVAASHLSAAIAAGVTALGRKELPARL